MKQTISKLSELFREKVGEPVANYAQEIWSDRKKLRDVTNKFYETSFLILAATYSPNMIANMILLAAAIYGLKEYKHETYVELGALPEEQKRTKNAALILTAIGLMAVTKLSGENHEDKPDTTSLNDGQDDVSTTAMFQAPVHNNALWQVPEAVA